MNEEQERITQELVCDMDNDDKIDVDSEWISFAISNGEIFDKIDKKEMNSYAVTIMNPPEFEAFKRIFDAGKHKGYGIYGYQEYEFLLMEKGIERFESDLKKFNFFNKYKIVIDTVDRFVLPKTYPNFTLRFWEKNERGKGDRFTVHMTKRQRARIAELGERTGFLSDSETTLVCLVYAFNTLVGVDTKCRGKIEVYCKTYLANIRRRISEHNREMNIWLGSIAFSVFDYMVRDIFYNESIRNEQERDVNYVRRVRLAYLIDISLCENEDVLIDYDKVKLDSINLNRKVFRELIIKYPDLINIKKK